MARYIDANELIERLKNQYGEELGWQCTINMSDVGMMIEDAPTADVVEVVRCKDCDVPHNKWTGCPYMNGLIPPQNHFCSFGERKE